MKTPFLKLYGDDWYAGTRMLTMEQKGFYLELLLLMWDRKAGLPCDPRWLSSAMQIDPRTARRLTCDLIRLGKIEDEAGTLVNRRMMRDIEEADLRKTSPRSQREVSEKSEEDQPEISEKKPETQANSTAGQNVLAGARFQKPEAIFQNQSDTHDRLHTTSASGHGEISGLNGSTAEIVNGIAKFLNAWAPDHETARRVVASNCGIYGDQAVRDGYAELMADVEDNRVRVPSVKVLVGYFKVAKERRAAKAEAPAKPAKPKIMDLVRASYAAG